MDTSKKISHCLRAFDEIFVNFRDIKWGKRAYVIKDKIINGLSRLPRRCASSANRHSSVCCNNCYTFLLHIIIILPSGGG